MVEGSTSYCPLPAGPFAFSSTIPWGNNRELTSLNTRLRAVDPFGKELLCLDVTTTPLDPAPHSVYGRANIILWSTVGLTLAYWFVVGIARVTTAWNRGISRPGKGVWSRVQSAGFIIASAISGERLAASPALLRFCKRCCLSTALNPADRSSQVHPPCETLSFIPSGAPYWPRLQSNGLNSSVSQPLCPRPCY